jgi:flagellar basal body P-ring formation protein FlgA
MSLRTDSSPLSSLLLLTATGVVLALCASTSVAQAQSPMAATTGTTLTTTGDTTALPRGYRRVTWPVATRALGVGDTVRATDFTLRDSVIAWPWQSKPDSVRNVAGFLVRRPIAIGEVLRAPAIMATPVVTAGSTVNAIWQDGVLRLVLSGVATNTAALGAAVGVRIDRTRRLDGIAVAPNTVRLR